MAKNQKTDIQNKGKMENDVRKKPELSKKKNIPVQNKSKEAKIIVPKQKKTSKKDKPVINSTLIVEVITSLVGDNVVDLVIELITQDDYSEFKLAEKLDMDVNATRNMLYKLLEHNLVSFTRRKDKRKGWYIYYWTFRPKDIDQNLLKIKEKILHELKSKIEREFHHDVYFICENVCEKYDFDAASEHEFKCLECGQLLQQHDNTQMKKDVLTQIDSLSEEIHTLKGQISLF